MAAVRIGQRDEQGSRIATSTDRQNCQGIIEQTRNMFDGVTFRIELGPLVDDDLVAGRWSGRGRSGDGDVSFTGNDILRISDGRFVEYWTGTSAG